MPTPRQLAYKTLLQWRVLHDPPFLPDKGDPAWSGLSGRDRAFTFDLITGIMRWRGTLDAIIASRLRQPLAELDQEVQTLLRLGAYQLLFQQGTTDYAAVDTTVDLAKQLAPRASGLINAVLRNITRLNPAVSPRAKDAPLSIRTIVIDFETQLQFSANIFPNPDATRDAHLAATRSHPIEFVRYLRGIYGDKATADLLLRNNIRPAITFRVDADAIDLPKTAGLVPHAEAARFLVAAEGWNDTIEQFVAAGKISPQDPTAAKPVQALQKHFADRSPPPRILDLCAGLGTKTMQLARAFPNAGIIATDSEPAKLERLAARARQMGITNLTITPLEEIEKQKSKSEDRFDAILIDVPCSNTGVMAKRVQSRWRWPSLDHGALHKLQLKLLTEASLLIAKNGVLVYSTCSIDPRENQQLVKTFIESSPRVSPLFEEQTLPALSSAAENMHDGGYFCLLPIPS